MYGTAEEGAALICMRRNCWVLDIPSTQRIRSAYFCLGFSSEMGAFLTPFVLVGFSSTTTAGDDFLNRAEGTTDWRPRHTPWEAFKRTPQCTVATRRFRQIRAQSSRKPDFFVLPSAPPLRDEITTVERLPHQCSVGLEASTSTSLATPTKANSDPSSRWNSRMDLGWLSQNRSTLLLGGLLGGLGFDYSKPSSVLQAVGVLALIVAVHEAGHFLAARLQGIRVTRFAVGFGPTLFKYQDGGVEYCLNAVPLGGYVAFPDDEIRPDDPDLLKNRPIPQRALVISAGVIANILFAYLVLLAQISTVGKAETAFLPGVRVVVPDTPVAAASAAARAGLRTGDVILRIGDVTIPAGVSQVSDSVAAIRKSPGRELELTVRRGDSNGSGAATAAAGRKEGDALAVAGSSSSGSGSGAEVLSLRCTPDVGTDGQGRIGVQLTSNTYILHTYPKSATEVLTMTQGEFNRLSGTVFNGLKQIVTNFTAMSGQLSGPVAIVAAGSEVLRTDSAGLFQFTAIVNINLAAVNILPLPALDGGYLLLLGLEAVRGGRKLPAVVEQGVMASGFLLLTALGVGLVIRDTLNLL
ncbi:hypothetical protein Vafri_13664 [Volvox africanus]|uniref:PDZ domain-containing protein n=1 Tax=Volvox africanus TaxID=51714 RepID=A0A8J4BBS9_9CHLO|nr:hypothetical protein Vafri_13664 [Volvox africanus]